MAKYSQIRAGKMIPALLLGQNLDPYEWIAGDDPFE
jgi:hypothetical protein